MSETESEAQEEVSKCKSHCNPIGACLHNVRGTIAKVWVWSGMIALSVSFALLYTYCRGSLNRDLGYFILKLRFNFCDKLQSKAYCKRYLEANFRAKTLLYSAWSKQRNTNSGKIPLFFLFLENIEIAESGKFHYFSRSFCNF